MRIRAVFALFGMLVLVAWASPAGARTPDQPAGIHVVSATPSSFTVGLNSASFATSYRVYTARTPQELYVPNITSKTKQTTSSRPSITVSRLPYTTGAYYFRVETLNGSSHKWGSAIDEAGVRPAAPSNVHIVNGSTGTYLTWNPQTTGNGFVVTQATNVAMTQSRILRNVAGANYQYAPYGVTKGVRYYFQVRARNVNTLSSNSGQVSAVIAAQQTSLRVLTYNLLESTFDGTKEGDGTVASWRSRRVGAAALIRRASPDVVGVQEAAAWMTSNHGYGGERQVDDLLKLLPGYRLARTETPPTEHFYMRTGVYILYKPSTVRPVGFGGHFSIGDTRFGVYQELQSTSSNAKFLFVSTHVYAGSGAHYDTMRENETRSLYQQSEAIAARDHVRVVWAGDFNSDINAHHAFDGPGIVMRSEHNTDAEAVAIHRYSARYNSANQ